MPGIDIISFSVSHLKVVYYITMQAHTASLSENMSTSSTQRLAPDHAVTAVSQPQSSDDQEDEDMDVPEILEEIIEMLLSGLRDTVCLVNEILLVG